MAELEKIENEIFRLLSKRNMLIASKEYNSEEFKSVNESLNALFASRKALEK
jgi:hypothetical protein